MIGDLLLKGENKPFVTGNPNSEISNSKIGRQKMKFEGNVKPKE